MMPKIEIAPVKPGDTVLILSAPDEDLKLLVHAIEFSLTNSLVFKDNEVLVGFVKCVTSQIKYR